VKHIPDDLRRGYAGLITGLDDGIGTVLKALKDSGQEQCGRRREFRMERVV